MHLPSVSVPCPACHADLTVPVAYDPPVDMAPDGNGHMHVRVSVHAGQVTHACAHGLVVHAGDPDALPVVPRPRPSAENPARKASP